ncbi:MAG: preprotein translocase subunit SecG [Candidatus Dojkabacteria bacterium]
MNDNILAGVQLVISILLILAVLMQQRGTGVGSLFGGPSSIGGGEYFRARRGIEKFLFYSTIILATFLVITSFAFLYV